MVDDWAVRLKKAYENGYYSEGVVLSDEATGEPFPWQKKTCRDCPFWLHATCQVLSVYMEGTAHTCVYFDPLNHDAARERIQLRNAGRATETGQFGQWVQDTKGL